MIGNKGRVAGKRTLITAAANGIGRATALAFAAEGATVLATDAGEDDLHALALENPDIEVQILDVTCPGAISALFTDRQFDVIFNCAGWVHHGSIEECDETAWFRSFNVNVDSMYRICRAAIPGMVAQGGGSIVNMSSVVSSIKGAPNRFAYGATKAAVIGLTKAIAADYAPRHIRCNAVCPGTVHTPSLERRVADQGGDREAVWSSFIQRQPMGRLGKATEIAALVMHLGSDESAFTTGAAFVIDGGWSN